MKAPLIEGTLFGYSRNPADAEELNHGMGSRGAPSNLPRLICVERSSEVGLSQEHTDASNTHIAPQ